MDFSGKGTLAYKCLCVGTYVYVRQNRTKYAACTRVSVHTARRIPLLITKCLLFLKRWNGCPHKHRVCVMLTLPEQCHRNQPILCHWNDGGTLIMCMKLG